MGKIGDSWRKRWFRGVCARVTERRVRRGVTFIEPTIPDPGEIPQAPRLLDFRIFGRGPSPSHRSSSIPSHDIGYVLMDKPHQRSVKDTFNDARTRHRLPSSRSLPLQLINPCDNEAGYAYLGTPPVIASVRADTLSRAFYYLLLLFPSRISTIVRLPSYIRSANLLFADSSSST